MAVLVQMLTQLVRLLVVMVHLLMLPQATMSQH